MAVVEVRESEIEGLGVFALRTFTPGETVLTLDTSRVVDNEHPLRAELGEVDSHSTVLGGDTVVLLPAPERHLNHSCDPSAALRTVGGEVRVIARRRIWKDEEVTLDYLVNTHGGTRWECRCGAARCRGLLEASFFDLPVALQLAYLPLLEPWFVERHADQVHALEEQALPDPGLNGV